MVIGFMNSNFARSHQIPLPELMEKNQVQAIDGRPVESGDITHITKVGIDVHDHCDQLPMFVTIFGHYPIVLGIPLLLLYDVAVRFASNTVTSGLQCSITHCHNAPVTVHRVTEKCPRLACQNERLFER
jgi:hypothetical protein